MSFLTAAEDASLFTDVVLSALDNVVHTDGEESAFVRALTTLDLDTLSKFCSHKFGALLAQPARPADLAGLKDEILAAAGATRGWRRRRRRARPACPRSSAWWAPSQTHCRAPPPRPYG